MTTCWRQLANTTKKYLLLLTAAGYLYRHGVLADHNITGEERFP